MQDLLQNLQGHIERAVLERKGGHHEKTECLGPCRGVLRIHPRRCRLELAEERLTSRQNEQCTFKGSVVLAGLAPVLVRDNLCQEIDIFLASHRGVGAS